MNRSKRHLSFCVAQQTPHLVVRSHPGSHLTFEGNERLMRGISKILFTSDWLENLYLELDLNLHLEIMPEFVNEGRYP